MCKTLVLFPSFSSVSNNLVHISLQLGTFHAHYTNHKNWDVLLTLYEVYKEPAVRISEPSLWMINVFTSSILNWVTFSLENLNTAQEIKRKRQIIVTLFLSWAKLNPKKDCHPKMKAGCRRPGAARAHPWRFQILILFSKELFSDLFMFKSVGLKHRSRVIVLPMLEQS